MSVFLSLLMKQDLKIIIGEEFLHYQKAIPDVLDICKLTAEQWDALELYKKVHINEFYFLISEITYTPKKILEWGSGLSTYILAYFCRKWQSKLFLTIDHNADYQARILAQLEKPSVFEARVMTLTGGIWPGEDDCNYATYPLARQTTFDFVFVDGRRRNECLLVTSKILCSGGQVILHDVWRSRYAVGMSLFKKITRLDCYAVMGMS